jgi:hypothetical protein
MISSSMRTGNGREATASRQSVWLPPGVAFASLPKPVQEMVVDILDPLYRQYVAQPSDALERAQGVSFCNLLILELLTTHSVAGRAADLDWARLPTSRGLAALVGITGQKNKIANFLLALRKFRDRVERADTASPQVRQEPGGLEKHENC